MINNTPNWQTELTVEVLELAWQQMQGSHSVVDQLIADHNHTSPQARNSQFQASAKSLQVCFASRPASELVKSFLQLLPKVEKDPAKLSLLVQTLIARSMLIGCHAHRNLAERGHLIKL